MFNIGGGEILVILVVALIFLGPSKLPEIARTLGKTTQTLRRISESFRSELSSAVDENTEMQARQRGNDLTVTESLPPADLGITTTDVDDSSDSRRSEQENETTE
ncbi:MAG: twin-arginine translocase subunit TatB [Actinobacteria bacterium]|nr:twin-arginine translocase subunit TatB [Actinomycetota bacterium]